MGVGSGVSSADGGEDAAEPWRTSDRVVRATNRGVAHMERYEYPKAVEAFEEALKAAPESTETRVNLAISLYNRCGKEDLKRAEELLDAVLEDDPANIRAWYFRGISHQYSGRDEEAVRCFERVLEQSPHDATSWYLLARSKSHLGQSCRKDLERAVQENPALVSAYYDLMRFARQDGDQEKATEYMEKFTHLNQSPLAEKVVMPNYNQMGPLATVRPVSTTIKGNISSGELSTGPAKILFQAEAPPAPSGTEVVEQAKGCKTVFGGPSRQPAVADVNGDGHLDMVTTAVAGDNRIGMRLLLGQGNGTLVDATEDSGLASVSGVNSCAFGDYDNDGQVDLFAASDGHNHLFRGQGDGTFKEVTAKTKTGGADVVSWSAVFLDADHDSDLDIYVCNVSLVDDSASTANQLLNNNGDGTFTDIATEAGVSCENDRSVAVTHADVDGDRDTDLIVFNYFGPARVFFNDRLSKYHEGTITTGAFRGDAGGVLQDFNGDGAVDLLVSARPHAFGRLHLSDGTGLLRPSSQFEECVGALGTWEPGEMTRVVDIDLDGDLDIAVLRIDDYVLLNDGRGRFVAKTGLWRKLIADSVVATELADFTGDGVPDVLTVSSEGCGRIEVTPTVLTPPANWLAITPTGDRGADKRTRSPASGFGTRVELRCGLHRQVVTYKGLNGGSSQSRVPLILGLNGATKADYLHLTWPDGVTQCENELAANTHYRIKEMERRVSSCPVLFAWNGERFGFIGDFAGVGGLGYYVAPNEYAPPQPLEHVKIEPEQLAAKDGFYELRVCEPMEEVAYVDRLELLTVDHPRKLSVYPDERLAITGPPPTHQLLCPAKPISPVKATAPDGTDCTERLNQADRVYAYQPKLDRRFYGFCESHSLIVDFGDRLCGLNDAARSAAGDLSPKRQGEGHRPVACAPGSEKGGDGRDTATGAAPRPNQNVYLFLNGWIEYPYSQTTYAASQAGVDWEPMRIDVQTDDGQWQTIIPDAGAPGGMGRMIAIDLTGKLPRDNCKLRISTNLEIYYDQVFIAADRGTDDFTINSAPLAGADLHRLGFPMEYSPDGQHPYIYTYDVIEPTSSFKTPKGFYTRYGPVESLLTDFDDRYVILGTGDELAIRFDAGNLPPLAEGWTRSFILVSHAYCKDMDLYTGAPDTVAPLPFRSMSRYPYPQSEDHPDGDKFQSNLRRLNTRVVE